MINRNFSGQDSRPGKICRAAVLSASLIFAGTAYAGECKDDNTTWGLIKNIAGHALKIIDGTDALGNQGKYLEVIDSMSEGADKGDIEELKCQLSAGFRNVRLGQARDIIGQAQNEI